QRRQRIGPAFNQFAVRAANSEHLGDDDCRQRVGEVANHVQPASPRGGSKQLAHEVFDLRLQVLNDARSENFVSEAAQASMVGRVEEQHPHRERGFQRLPNAFRNFRRAYIPPSTRGPHEEKIGRSPLRFAQGQALKLRLGGPSEWKPARFEKGILRYLLVAAVSLFFFPGVPAGMEMSSAVTGPKEESGRS